MNCPRCGSRIKKSTNFCPKCGLPVSREQQNSAPNDRENPNEYRMAGEYELQQKKKKGYWAAIFTAVGVLAGAAVFILLVWTNVLKLPFLEQGSGQDKISQTTPQAEKRPPTPVPEADGYEDRTWDEFEIPGSELIRVGIVNIDPNVSGYRTANDADMRAMFTEMNGYQASFAYSLKNDEQIAAAQKFIQDGVDYLLLCAADYSDWDSILWDAQYNGVGVILFDRTIDTDESLYLASIVSDMRAEGDTAVKWLRGQRLDSYNIIHIQGIMGSAAQIGRSEAMNEMAEAEGWNIVTQQTAEWNAEKAQQIVESVIDQGTEFNVIYAENDDMAKGAVAALDKANISHGKDGDVIIMGFDTNKWALTEVLEGRWNYDGQCNPYQASYIDEIIKKDQAGEEITEKTIIMEEKGFDCDTITQEDVDTYGI